MEPLFRFPRYDAYKDSGADWLGEVPSAWSVESLRAVTQLKSKKNQPDLQVLSVYRDYGVILKDSRDDNHNATSLDTSSYKVVNEGDLVVNKMKAWQGSMGVSEHRGIVSPAYITCRVDAERVYPKFLHYLLRSKPYIGVYNALSYGVRVGQWDMHYEDFKHIPLPLPDREQQQRIANFLDQKTAEIDEAITKKQRLIELLKEQKAILINQAVTKGLKPDVPMRDSGVEWIGEVPEHWELRRLKHVVIDIVDSEHKTAPEVEDGKYLITRTSNVRDGKLRLDGAQYADYSTYQKWTKRAVPESGDILLTREAPAGEACVLGKDNYALLGQRMVLLKVNKKVLDSSFCVHSIYGGAAKKFIQTLSVGSTVTHFNMSDIKNIPLLLPPINEQNLISVYLSKVVSAFDEGVEKELEGIENLNEFKSILISNAVTGKIKI